MAGFVSYGEAGQGQYSKDNSSSHYTAEIATALIPAWICNHIHYKVWDEINYPFLNFNGATVEV